MARNLLTTGSMGNAAKKRIGHLRQKAGDGIPRGGRLFRGGRVLTGFRDLDGVLCGMRCQELLVLAAKPSMGKTALALTIAENVARGMPGQASLLAGIFSLQMGAKNLAIRLVRQKDPAKLMEEFAVLQKLPIYVDDSSFEVEDLRETARKMRERHGVGLLVVDYFELVRFGMHAREGLQRERGEIARALKEMAEELDVPVLVLSQLQKNIRDLRSGIPEIPELPHSAPIEPEADVVMLLRRASWNKSEHLAILNVAKNRNGEVGEVKLHFDSDSRRFGNWGEME